MLCQTIIIEIASECDGGDSGRGRGSADGPRALSPRDKGQRWDCPQPLLSLLSTQMGLAEVVTPVVMRVV